MSMNKELEDFMKKSKEVVARMTPQEYAALLESQKASFVRGMSKEQSNKCQPGGCICTVVIHGNVFTIYRCVVCGEEEWL